jgi:predicted secreted hydrolase
MWRDLRRLIAIVCVLALPLAAACSSDPAPRPVPTPAAPEPTPIPRPVSLPADEGTHDDRLEWWYYSGHLTAETGEQFGFHFVIFQSRDAGRPAYSAQFGITDVAGQEHTVDARLFVGDSLRDEVNGFGLRVRDWDLAITGAGHSFDAHSLSGDGLGLTFERDLSAPPMLHGAGGWIGGPTGWTYYYSWPDMPASGTLTLGGKTYNVTGTGWFDHQWGDLFVLGAPAGWQWLALDIGGGGALMVTESRSTYGSVEALYGTWRAADGSQRTLTAQADGIELEVLDRWTSPDTGGDYPSRWRLTVESLGLDVEIVPVVADQEVTRGVPQGAVYWEGKVALTGSYRGQRVSQPGYVELTGYVQPPVVPWRATAQAGK